MPGPAPFIPPEVYQWPQFGFAPQGGSAPTPDQPPVFAPQPNLPPEVLNGMGWAPAATPTPPAPIPAVPPVEYRVPVEAFKGAPTQNPAAQKAQLAGGPPPSAEQAIQRAGQTTEQALGRQEQAQQVKGELGAARAQEERPIYEQAATQAQDQVAKQTAQNAADAEMRSTLTANINKAVDAEAAYHIDPNRKWKSAGTGQKIGSAIAIILSSVGQAMMRQPGNPALDIIQKGIQDDVEAQRTELEKKGRAVNHAQQQLQNYTAMTGDQRAAAQLLEATQLKAQAADIRAIGAKYAAPDAKLNAETAAAQLEERAGVLQLGVADKLGDLQVKKRQLALEGARVGIAGRAQQLDEKKFLFDQKKEMDQLAVEYEKLGQKDRAAKAKQVGEEGIFNPTTGDPLLTARGREMVGEADKLEAQARQDPTQSQALQQKAQELRNEARSGEVAVVADKEARKEIRTQLASSQAIIDATAKVKEFLRTDPAAWDREGWAAAKSQLGAAIAQYASTIGERNSPRAFDSIKNEVLNFDPSSIMSRVGRKAPGVASIEAVEGAIRTNVDTALRAHGIKDGWVPRASDAAPEATFGGRTDTELGGLSTRAVAPDQWGTVVSAAGKKGGDLNAAAGEVANEAGVQAASTRTNAEGVRSNYGLDPADDDRARGLVRAAQTASNAERARIADTLAQPLLKGPKFDPNAESPATWGARPSLGSGIISLVRAEDPKLYQEVLARLPPLQAQAIQQYDQLFDQFGRPRAQAGR